MAKREQTYRGFKTAQATKQVSENDVKQINTALNHIDQTIDEISRCKKLLRESPRHVQALERAMESAHRTRMALAQAASIQE